jgi:peroxiredoxin
MDLEFDITELPPADHVRVGDTAPAFTRPLVNDEYWEDVSLSELLEDGPVVLVFHSMDGDFPAMYTFKEIRKRGWGEWEDCAVVGVSISTPYEHKEFQREWTGFEQFRFFSDPDCGVGEAYGVTHDLDGMAITEHRPAAFVVDTTGTVQYAWTAEEYPAFPPYDELEAAVDAL